jgi:hypothetical protein
MVHYIGEDILAIKNGPTDKVADSADGLIRIDAHERSIETFKRCGRSVVLVKSNDVKVQDKQSNQTYAKCKILQHHRTTSRSGRRKMPKPSGRTMGCGQSLTRDGRRPWWSYCRLFKTARDLVQQRIYETQDLKESVTQEMESKTMTLDWR